MPLNARVRILFPFLTLALQRFNEPMGIAVHYPFHVAKTVLGGMTTIESDISRVNVEPSFAIASITNTVILFQPLLKRFFTVRL